MKIKNDDDLDDAEVSMSPLIDCVFLLLIFFLVSTMVKKKDRDIDVDLPESRSAVEMKPDNDVLVIGIDREGKVHWQGESCSATWLHTNLRSLSASDPDRRIRIDVDKKTKFRAFAEVMDACQFYSLENVGLRTYDEHYNSR